MSSPILVALSGMEALRHRKEREGVGNVHSLPVGELGLYSLRVQTIDLDMTSCNVVSQDWQQMRAHFRPSLDKRPLWKKTN